MSGAKSGASVKSDLMHIWIPSQWPGFKSRPEVYLVIWRFRLKAKYIFLRDTSGPSPALVYNS